LSVDDALRLAVKVMNKTMDTTTMTPERLEFCTLKRESEKVVIKTLSLEETKALVAEVSKYSGGGGMGTRVCNPTYVGSPLVKLLWSMC
jgi:hypothetical protein